MAMVVFFGVIAEVINKNEMELDIDTITVSDFVSQLIADYNLESFEFIVALNKIIVPINSNILITRGDEIAFLPPFAGG